MFSKRGFTLIEILVVIALLGILTLSAIIWYNNSTNNQLLKSSAETLADEFRRAHIFSREYKDEKSWGIRALSLNEYSLYYVNALSEETIVQTLNLPKNIRFNENFNIIFDRQGNTLTTTEINLLNNLDQKLKVIVLESGVVEVTP